MVLAYSHGISRVPYYFISLVIFLTTGLSPSMVQDSAVSFNINFYLND